MGRFLLSSEQCELITAFEAADSLEALAHHLAREMSVVSRQIKRLAETAPVLEKRKGRWHITPLGRQIASWSREAIADQERIVGQHALRLSAQRLARINGRTALLMIGCQRGFADPSWGARNDDAAEANMERLLGAWRRHGRSVIHVQHVSREQGSPLHPTSGGHQFLPFAAPRPGEPVVGKSGGSAFHDTKLAADLRGRDVDALVVAGFTLNHCVDATIRAGADLGFSMHIVADATVSFGRFGPRGRWIAADALHAASLACLGHEFATVLDTEDLVGDLAAAGVDGIDDAQA